MINGVGVILFGWAKSPIMLEQIRQKVSGVCGSDDLTVTKVSATVSSSCGPNTFGILFIRK